MKRWIAGLALLVMLIGVCEVRAAIHTLTTNGQVTIGDDSPPDGIPDTFYPGGRYPPVLNAAWTSGNELHRAVMEFDIGTLSGISINSAVLDVVGDFNVPFWCTALCLSGYFGDGAITFDDWTETANQLYLLVPGDSLNLDVTTFVQSAISTV